MSERDILSIMEFSKNQFFSENIRGAHWLDGASAIRTFSVVSLYFRPT
jgi:hypothetical protein